MFNIQKLERYLLNCFSVGAGIALLTPLFLRTHVLRPFIFSKMIAIEVVVLCLAIIWTVLMAIDWQKYRPRFNWLIWILTSFVGLVLLSSIFGLNFYRSFWGNAERMDGFLALFYFYVFCLSLISVLKDKKEIFRKLIFTFILGGFLSVCWVIGQKFGIIPLPDSENLIRPGGLFGNPTFFSGYLLVNLFLSIWYFITSLFKESQESKWKITQSSIWAMVFCLFDLIGLVWTQTRGSWLGLCLAIFVFLVVSVFILPKKIKIAAGSLALIIILAVAGFLGFKDQIRQSNLASHMPLVARLSKALASDDSNSWARLYSWQWAIGWSKERPILGVGQDMFYSVFDQKYNPNDKQLMSERFDRAHNKFIDILVMNGALSLLAYLSLLVGIFWVAFKKCFRSESALEKAGWLAIISLFVATTVHNFFVFETPVNYLAFFFVLAWLVVFSGNFADKAKEKKLSTPQASANKIGLMVLVSILAGGFVFYHVNYKPYQAARLCYDAAVKADQTNLGEIFSYYKKGIEKNTFLSPEITKIWGDHFLRYLGYASKNGIAFSASDLRSYIDDFSKSCLAAVSREPMIDFYVYPATIYTQLGWWEGLDQSEKDYYFLQSKEVFSEMIKLWPGRIDYYILWLEDNFFRRNYDQVDSLLKDVLEKAPKYGRAIWLKSALETVRGNFLDGASKAREAIINNGFDENWSQSNVLTALSLAIPDNQREMVLAAFNREFDSLKADGRDNKYVPAFAGMMAEFHRKLRSQDFVRWADYLRRSLEGDPSNADSWATLAVVSVRLSDKEGALEAARQAAIIDPNGYGKNYQSFADSLEKGE